MSYNPSIPTGTDFLLQSQAQIRANYQDINIVWDDNHFNLTQNNENQGMHNVLTMRPQSVDPTTDATHVALYNKVVTISGAAAPELFYAPNNAQTPIQLTYPSISVAANLPQQYSFVAGPFIVYAGILTGLSNASNGSTINLTPTSTLVYVATNLTNLNGNSDEPKVVIPTDISGSSFKIKFKNFIPGSTFSVYYLALGTP